jgi:hypothetical protein
MDGNSVNTSQYSFNSASYSDGNHKLRMEIWAYSGSGSLADRAQAEFLVSSREWTLFIDNRVFTGQVSIDSCFCENGSLTVKWQKFPYYNFVSYNIYRAYVDTNGNSTDFLFFASVNDRNIIKMKDSTYAGGGRKYKLVVSAGSKSYTSPEKYFNDQVAGIYSVVPLDQNTVKIVCSRIKYYSNVSKFTLYRYYYDNKYFSVAEHSSPDDTVFYDTPGFGHTFYYLLSFSGTASTYGASLSKTFFLGNAFPSFNDLIFNQQLNSYYLLTGYSGSERTDRLDASNLNFMATCPGTVMTSASGNLAYSNRLGASGDPYPHSFAKVNPLTLQAEGTTVYTDKYVGYYSTNTSFVVSETGLIYYVGCRYKDPTLYGYGANILFDPNLPAMIGKDSTSDSYWSGLVQFSAKTAEGEYFIPPGSGGLYDIQIRTLYKIGALTSGPYCFSQSGKEYICTGNSAISIYKCSNMSLIKSFSLGNAEMLYYPCIDPVTGYLGGYSKVDCKYKIFDLNNGNIVKEIQLPADYFLLGKYYCYNSTLFSDYGFYMNLSALKKRNTK